MGISSFAVLLTVLIALCLAAGTWLLLHLTAVAALFSGRADLVPSSKRPRASRGAVIAALVLFCGSLAGILAAQAVAIGA